MLITDTATLTVFACVVLEIILGGWRSRICRGPPFGRRTFIRCLANFLQLYCFFLSVLLDNSKSIKRKEVSKAADKGAPSKLRASTDSTPPSPKDDFQDNTCINTQQSCVYDEHVSPSEASLVLPLTWHCYMWLHVMCDV